MFKFKKTYLILLVTILAVSICVPSYAADTQDGMTITNNDSQGGEPGAGGQEDPGAGGEEELGTGGQDEPNAGGVEDPGTGDHDEPGAGDEEDPGTGDHDEPGAGGEEDPGTGGQDELGAGDEEDPGTGDQDEPGAGDEEDPGTGGQEELGAGGEEDPGTGGQEEPAAGGEEIENPTIEIEEPVIEPPVVPDVEMPVIAQRVPSFEFIGSGIVKTRLTASESSTIKLLSVSGIPKGINIRVFVDNEKVAEVIGGILENSQEFTITSGSKDVEFVISGYGDMSKSNMNFVVL